MKFLVLLAMLCALLVATEGLTVTCDDQQEGCPVGSTCAAANGTCTCSNGFSANAEDDGCIAAAGALNGACKANDVCDTEDTECTDNKCVCESGYKADEAGTACVKSAAAGVTVSVVVLVSGFMASYFL
ncbi:hypothetical protein BaRGS_00017950 [Batillaria attramentaria]|uniref:Uncharacterized protein n=1 Tax=Batillaria attramentaria TaxID=370345 RepID=A0ABD0KTX8_9CAEN